MKSANNTHKTFKTPDGALELTVIHDKDDITIGFRGYDWHTHGDVLVGEYALLGITTGTPEQTVERFLADMQANKVFIVVCRKNNVIEDVYASLQEPEEAKYLQPGETVVVRFWSK